MKYFKSIPVIIFCMILLSGCSSFTDKSAAKNKMSAEKTAIPVKVLTLAKTKIARTIDYTATILPYEEVNMAPSSPGRIERIYVENGDKVNKGDNLFLMDRTQLYQLKLQLANLEKDLNRLDTLLITGSVKQQTYDQTKTQYDVLKTNVNFMENNTLVKAPFTGVITGKYFEEGEMYSGAPTTMSGKAAIVTLMQVDLLKVNVAVSEQYYPLIKKGMNATITADVYKDEIFNGKVLLVSPTINSATRSFITEIELPNKNELLKPGMFVRVSMNLGEVETFVVPASTVLLQEGTNVRYVYTEDQGVAKRVEVLLGKRFDDKLEIISDNLSENDRIVSEGQSRLLNDDKIEIVE
jgi:membrane fusion protein (multidrug efflux system)